MSFSPGLWKQQAPKKAAVTHFSYWFLSDGKPSLYWNMLEAPEFTVNIPLEETGLTEFC